MFVALEEITEKALKLPGQERLALANRLLSNDENADTLEVESGMGRRNPRAD